MACHRGLTTTASAQSVCSNNTLRGLAGSDCFSQGPTRPVTAPLGVAGSFPQWLTGAGQRDAASRRPGKDPSLRTVVRHARQQSHTRTRVNAAELGQPHLSAHRAMFASGSVCPPSAGCHTLTASPTGLCGCGLLPKSSSVRPVFLPHMTDSK